MTTPAIPLSTPMNKSTICISRSPIPKDSDPKATTYQSVAPTLRSAYLEVIRRPAVQKWPFWSVDFD
jgi:hypothetical protein